jgi:chromosome segregation ATPase
MNSKDRTHTAAEIQMRAAEIISGAQAEAARIVTEAREHAARDKAAIDRLVAEGVAAARALETAATTQTRQKSFAELAEQAQAARSFFERALEVSSALHAAATAEQRASELTASLDALKAQLVQTTAQRDAVLRERDAALVERNRLEADAGDFEARLAVARQKARDLINGAQQ